MASRTGPGAAASGLARFVTRDAPRFASGLAVEVGWTAAHLLMYPLGIWPNRLDQVDRRHDLGGLSAQQRSLFHADLDASGTPILLVHGIVDNHSIFTVMEHALRGRG